MTDKLIIDIEKFKTKKLEKMYATIFIDTIKFKIGEDGYSKEISVHTTRGITMNGTKQILGLEIAEFKTSNNSLIS